MIDADIRVLPPERADPWHQPKGRYRRRRTDRYGRDLALRPNLLKCSRGLLERSGEDRIELFALAREFDAAMNPFEQSDPELALERLDLMTHRARSHVQLDCSTLQAEMPGGGVECGEGRERGADCSIASP